MRCCNRDRSLPRGTGRYLGGPVVTSGDRSLPRGTGRYLGGPVVASGDRSLLRGTGCCFGGPVVASGDRLLPRGTGRCFGGPVVASGDRSLVRGTGRCFGGLVVTLGDRALLHIRPSVSPTSNKFATHPSPPPPPIPPHTHTVHSRGGFIRLPFAALLDLQLSLREERGDRLRLVLGIQLAEHLHVDLKPEAATQRPPRTGQRRRRARC